MSPTVTVAGQPAVQVSIPISGPALATRELSSLRGRLDHFRLLFDAIEPGPAWDALASSFHPVAYRPVHGVRPGRQLPGRDPPCRHQAAAVTTVTGYLNPDDFRSAVNLYQFTLGPTPGNLWQLGLAEQSHAIGSPLQADLTLFRSDGSVVASATLRVPACRVIRAILTSSPA